MPGRDSQHPALGQERGAAGQVVLVHGEVRQLEVEVASSQHSVRVGERHLAYLDGEFGMGGAQLLGRPHHHLSGQGRGEADVQDSFDAARRGDGTRQGVLDAAVVRFEVVTEALAQAGEGHTSARAREQRCSDAAFQLLDELTHAGAGEVQAGGGAAEVQFFGEGEKAVELVLVHDVSGCVGAGIGKPGFPNVAIIAVVPVRGVAKAGGVTSTHHSGRSSSS